MLKAPPPPIRYRDSECNLSLHTNNLRHTITAEKQREVDVKKKERRLRAEENRLTVHTHTRTHMCVCVTARLLGAGVLLIVLSALDQSYWEEKGVGRREEDGEERESLSSPCS